MTSTQFQAVCKAISYIIKHMPKETSERGKAERTAVLQGLTNAMRPSQTLAADPPSSQTHAAGSATASPHDAPQPAAPSIIGVNIIPPGGALPGVRAGTTAGTPFTPRVADTGVDQD